MRALARAAGLALWEEPRFPLHLPCKQAEAQAEAALRRWVRAVRKSSLLRRRCLALVVLCQVGAVWVDRSQEAAPVWLRLHHRWLGWGMDRVREAEVTAAAAPCQETERKSCHLRLPCRDRVLAQDLEAGMAPVRETGSAL